ncbi:MAG TPA: ribonuclease HII [Chloroflexi bacterium]|nr:ribonuclease HII [Chloroflexota bacterium]HHW86854.1 ribonuclease HII [Chloroflexota bacterium]
MKTEVAPGASQAPTLEIEQSLWAAGWRRVAGIDEAGRGALAGPVVAAAVVVTPEQAAAPVWSLVRDSKLLSPAQRETLAAQIQAAAAAWAVGVVDACEIDAIGIAAATRLAMQQAVAALACAPDHLLIDWVRLPTLAIRQLSQPKADRTMASVAAASILAKVHRDHLMAAYERQFPGYGFAAHKGYGVAVHLAALAQHGPCALHRHSFAPIAQHSTLFDP